jgi:SAM-dependent methyltransferase
MAELSVTTVSGLASPLDFLAVDEFLKTIVDARALRTAFELGLIDRLLEARAGGSAEALGRVIGADAVGMRLLLDLLRTMGVTEERAGDVRLTPRFRSAMRFRDFLEAKLDFIGFVLNDFADLFTAMVKGRGGATEQARLFQLFDYRRCLEDTPENYIRTRVWMRITSSLTRYEVEAAAMVHDFGVHRRMLDVGGNSGQFALQLCRRHPGLHGTIFDLPLVCEIGLEHVLGEPEHDRISFIKGDVRRDALPADYDLISFKSMLHDWPAKDVAAFLAKAVQALAPGGTLLIFERGPLRFDHVAPPVSLLPTLLFFRSYRPASEYVAQLGALGCRDVQVRDVFLDSPFFVVTARKPDGA